MGVKVLHILGGMGRGGAPSFIINNMKKTKSSEVEYDFLVRKDNCAFNSEIEEHGGRVFVVSEFPRHFIKNYIETVRFFNEHKNEYVAVHIHANALLYMLPIKLATKKWKCEVIIHSHNTESNIKGASIIHQINRTFRIPSKCICLACGQEAGRWMFGNRKFEVINNAVDTELFRYSYEKRKKIRKELNLSSKAFVIGNIGRFEYAKNPEFIIDIFYEFLKMNSNSYLVLVGTGSLGEKLRELVTKYNIEEKVIFTGERRDPYNLYSAFDFFLMPSRFEGLPFTLIEAQAAGTPCLISENITHEVDLTDLIIRLKLDDNAKIWADKIYSFMNKEEREQYAERIVNKKYDTGVTSRRLKEIYLNGV